MRFPWSAIRLSAGLVSLCLTVVFLACILGLVPDRKAAIHAGRQALAESLAVQCSLAAEHDDLGTAQACLQTALDRNPDIRSAELLRPDGSSILRVGAEEDAGKSTEIVRLQVPIERDGHHFGLLELRFDPLTASWFAADSLAPFIAFVAVMCFGVFTAFLRPALASGQLRPPARADVERETPRPGDRKAAALSGLIEVPPEELVGMPTFEDITSLERKHAQLRKVLIRLRRSRKVVRRQNHELKALATRDPLTGCFNRRTLFAEFEKHWETSERSKKPLACMMLDIDHFKSINDEHGHSVGDQVLKGIAEALRQTARRSDFVCRYGGEEFCIVLPQVDLAEAIQAAERFRQALTAEPFGGVQVTASFGISARCLGANHPQELLDQADKALFAAKRSGRNRSIRFDEAPPELLLGGPDTSRRKVDSEAVVLIDGGATAIPYQAVSGLLAALAYRHPETAEHSKRVADLCVTVGCGLLSQKDLYVVEMGALLHDLGKLGIPDNVLLKDEALTPEDWKTLRSHETIGVEIIRTAFTSEALEAIVQLQNAWFGGTPTDPTLPKGTKIPLGARLLAIVNAYDSMTNDQVYRKARPQAEAFAELQRCAGTQFDPALVDHFVLAMANPSATPPRKPALTVNKRAALRIGVQIEKLANAADVQDVAGLQAMAGQLKAMAEESGITTIAEVAGRLERTAASKANHVELMELTIELLEHCRQTQRTLLPQVRSRAARAERKRTASGEWRLPSKMELRLPNVEPRPKPPSI